MVSTLYSDGLAQRHYYFEEAVARDPDNWAVHMHMVVALTTKWGGNNEEMIAFVEELAETAPTGSDLPIILLKAYIEHWKYLDAFANEPEKAKAFIASDNIKNKALAAYQKSLGSEKHRESSSTIFARYNASAWFWTVRNKDVLKIELNALENKIDDIHWRWTWTEGGLEQAKAFVKGSLAR